MPKPTHTNKRPLVISGNYTTWEKRLVEFAFNKVKQCNPYNKSRHVSILCKGKKLVEFGLNNEESTYTHRFGYKSNHAEYEVLRRFLRFNTLSELSKLTLFNCRINRYNEVVNSRPCRKCAYLLEFFPTKSVYFSNDIGVFEQWQ